jgi:hypothetical protein
MTQRLPPLPAPALPVSVEGAPPEPRSPAAPGVELPADVAWLFRRSLAAGRIHPLMPLLLRYRRERGT